MLGMLFSKFLHVTFLTSMCEITYVPRWYRTDDSGAMCCLLTPTLYYFATEGLRTCIVICIFIFKFAVIFLNSEHNSMLFNNTLYYMSPDIVRVLIAYNINISIT